MNQRARRHVVSPPNPEARTRRRRLALGVLLAALAAGPAPISAAAVAAPAPAPKLELQGLERVEITSFQALPPPYKPGRAAVTSPAALAAFEKVVRTDRITLLRNPSNSRGCTGGVEYTVTLTAKSRKTTLTAYQCGGAITGNIGGNVKAFVRYLGSIV